MSRRKSSPPNARQQAQPETATPETSASPRPTRQPSPSTPQANDGIRTSYPAPSASQAQSSSTGVISAVTVGSQEPEPQPPQATQGEPAVTANDTQAQAEAIRALRSNLGIDRLEATLQELLARAAIAPLQPASSGGVGGIVKSIIETIGSALGKLPPPGENTGNMWMQRLIDQTMNHYAVLDSVLAKQYGLPPPAQHMRVVE